MRRKLPDGGKARRESAFCGNPGQQDAYGIGNHKPKMRQLFCRRRLELIVYADMQHRCLSSHPLVFRGEHSRMYLNQGASFCRRAAVGALFTTARTRGGNY